MVDAPISFPQLTSPRTTERTQRLLNFIRKKEPSICFERIRYVTEAYRRHEALPNILRRAKAVEHILANMSLYLLEDSLLAGNQASEPRSAPLFPEFDVVWIEEEILNGKPMRPDERPADRFQVKLDAETRKELREIVSWWRGKTHAARVYSYLPPEALKAQEEVGTNNIWGYMEGGVGHYLPDHPWLLRNGVERVIELCNRKLGELTWTDPDYFDKRCFYEAIIIGAQAMIGFAARYAQLSRSLAKQERDPVRQRELLELANICERVPAKPPRTFHEALQFIYFVHVVLHIEDSGYGISVGRLDQILWDHYVNDLKAGRLTSNRALELIEHFYVGLFSLLKVKSWRQTMYTRGYPMFQNLTIGGQDPVTRTDATNDLSYLLLAATADTRLVQPSLTARLHSRSPEEYKRKVAEVIRLGIGLPAVFNDEAYVPALLNRGYDLVDALNYAIVGCAEPGVSGLLGGRTGGSFFNQPKVLELALYGGRDPRTGVCLLENSGGRDLSTFSSYAEVWEAYLHQADFYLKVHAVLENAVDKSYAELISNPLETFLSCPQTALDRARTPRQGGAKYDFTGQQTLGTANVGNSLYAVKRLVFDEKRLTGAQLLHALRTDFRDTSTNPSGPQIREMCKAVPKYGNDVDEVDFICRDVLAYTCNRLTSFKNTRYGKGPIGGIIQASTTSVTGNVPFGEVCGALPDGRLAGMPLADGQSPMRGTDVKGPTAAVKSVARLNNLLLSGGSLYNLKFLPEHLRSEEGLRRFLALIEYYFSLGGMQMQFNVVSKETLREAQKHPEAYADLLVRVAGYVAYFVTLDRKVQEDIIERTEEQLV
ncbi:MAG: formate C-acetyltransferase/glycerol dehydratase family glycyl radical enzyme [Bacillota bacterium]|nr:formate C-acetyltransferase/glycerol dehydratase family glycyl radical enzyme [Bacillota bacterium]